MDLHVSRGLPLTPGPSNPELLNLLCLSQPSCPRAPADSVSLCTPLPDSPLFADINKSVLEG